MGIAGRAWALAAASSDVSTHRPVALQRSGPLARDRREWQLVSGPLSSNASSDSIRVWMGTWHGSRKTGGGAGGAGGGWDVAGRARVRLADGTAGGAGGGGLRPPARNFPRIIIIPMGRAVKFRACTVRITMRAKIHG